MLLLMTLNSQLLTAPPSRLTRLNRSVLTLGMAKGDGQDNETMPDEGAPTLLPDGPFRLSRDVVLAYQEQLANRIGSLLVIAGTQADIGNAVLVEGETRIGRENCQIQLADGRISRLHAMVEPRDGGYYLRDNGSTNGTLLNGQPVAEEAKLVDGDKIILGETVIKFTLVDQTEAEYMRTMDRLVGRDTLTGLLAKHRFDAALDEAVRQAVHTNRPLSAMMMDMDRLKQLNDACGHSTGAATIQRVGELIHKVLKGKGKACRFGGDEFTAFLPSASLPQAMEMGERIRSVVEAAALGPADSGVLVSISIGVAQLPADEDSSKGLLDLADLALYRAKDKGRNIVSD